MEKKLETKIVNESDLFGDKCKGCEEVEDFGDDEIIKILNPGVDTPKPLPDPTSLEVKIKCDYSDGVRGQVIALTATHRNGEKELSHTSTGPIKCPYSKD